MRRLFILLLALALASRLSNAQTATPAPSAPKATPSTSPSQAAVDQLTQSNRDLLDLLKQQQAVLVDIQYDRRLQARQIQSLEERLEESLLENAQLQKKIGKLEATASAPPAVTPSPTNPANAETAQTSPAPIPPVDQPPPPASYLPAPEAEGASGSNSWHRLFTLSGDDNKTSNIFHIEGRTWRVLWHNQDKPGKAYANTSALFINAFPKDDTIPQKVSSKLGSGGDSTELIGPGNYYLKIEASGGKWELAVEDYH